MKSIVKDRQEEGYVSIKDIVYALIVNIALLAIIANHFIQDPDSAKIDSARKKRVERRSDIINDFRRPDYFIDLHRSEDYILQFEYKSHWCNVCRTSWRTVSGIIFFSHRSNICTYLL